jgi:hypothetical protein
MMATCTPAGEGAGGLSEVLCDTKLISKKKRGQRSRVTRMSASMCSR